MSFALRAYELMHEANKLLTGLAGQVNRIEGKIDKMTDAQTHLDSDVQALGSAETGVESEVAALKAQIAAIPSAPPVDFTGLDAAVAKLQGDVPPPVTPPVVDPAPVTPPPAA